MARPRSSPADTTAEGLAVPREQPNRQRNILLAAERLFAERGYHGVSIRDIAEAAQVPLALVGYYFGPKLSLYHTVFRNRQDYVKNRTAAIEAVVTTFVTNTMETAATEEGRHYMRLIARCTADRLSEDQAIVQEMFDPLAHKVIDALAKALPKATRGQLATCYEFMRGALLLHVTDERIERLSNGESKSHDYLTTAPLLTRFLVAGINASCNR